MGSDHIHHWAIKHPGNIWLAAHDWCLLLNGCVCGGFTHQLDHGKGIARFDPDLKIAEAWKRLESGAHIESDLLILRHEHFESRFEGIFKTDYRTAHNAANRAGHSSGWEGLNTQEVKNGFIYRD